MTTKERISAEALTLFAENGYDGTGVEQIVEKVGIKAPSLYKHFKDKEVFYILLLTTRKRGTRNTSARNSASANCRRAERN